jgi:hypothetical protein
LRPARDSSFARRSHSESPTSTLRRHGRRTFVLHRRRNSEQDTPPFLNCSRPGKVKKWRPPRVDPARWCHLTAQARVAVLQRSGFKIDLVG